MKLAAVFVLAFPAFAQVIVTASPAVPDVVKAFLERVPPGVAAFSVVACGPPGSRASAGFVIQEAQKQGIFLFAPGATESLGLQAIGRSRMKIALDVGEGLALAGTFLTGGNVIKLTEAEKTKAVSVGAGLAGLAHWLAGKFQRTAPDPTKLRALSLPEEISLPAGGCWTGLTLGREPGK